MVVMEDVSEHGVQYCLSIQRDETKPPLMRHVLAERMPLGGLRAECKRVCEAEWHANLRSGDDLPAWEDCPLCFPSR